MYPGCRTDTLVMGSAPSPHVSSPNREARGEGRMDIGVDSVPAVRGAGLGRGGSSLPPRSGPRSGGTPAPAGAHPSPWLCPVPPTSASSSNLGTNTPISQQAFSPFFFFNILPLTAAAALGGGWGGCSPPRQQPLAPPLVLLPPCLQTDIPEEPGGPCPGAVPGCYAEVGGSRVCAHPFLCTPTAGPAGEQVPERIRPRWGWGGQAGSADVPPPVESQASSCPMRPPQHGVSLPPDPA